MLLGAPGRTTRKKQLLNNKKLLIHISGLPDLAPSHVLAAVAGAVVDAAAVLSAYESNESWSIKRKNMLSKYIFLCACSYKLIYI